MSKIGFALNFLKSITILSLILLIGCAEIGPPPGGAVDKVKPRIISSSPVNGSTLVEPGNIIEIVFSERILKPTAINPIYISPRLKSEPKISWKSDKVIITLPDSFELDQTYIITFAEGLQDLRRNPLDSGSIIAFTTGEALAGGMIDGTVTDKNNIPQPNVVTALYKTDTTDTDFRIDSLYPTYLGVTNSEGYFSFQYLPDGDYQLLAFTDKNKNDLFDNDTELFGLPTHRITLDSSQNKIQHLRPALTSSIEENPTIIAARQTDDNMFKIDFNLNILTETKIDFHNLNLSLNSYDSISAKHQYSFVLEPDSNNANSIIAYFSVLPEGLYNLQLDYNDSLLIFDSVQVKERVDKNNPEIKLFTPNFYKVNKDSLRVKIQFSEPLDTSLITKETFYFIDADSNLIFPGFEFKNQSLCSISNDFLIKDNYQYLLHISEFDIFDIAGNKLGDSTTKKIINIINPDSIGVVQGKVILTNLPSAKTQIVLLFKNVLTNQQFSLLSYNNSFDLRLHQGQYILSGYLDLNNNNKRDFGELYPLQFAEPFTIYSDTIKVRARFETTDIKLEF